MGGAGCCDTKAFGAPCAECAFDQTSVFAEAVGDGGIRDAAPPTLSSHEELHTQDQLEAADATAVFVTRMAPSAESVGTFWWQSGVVDLLARATGGESGHLHSLVQSEALLGPDGGDGPDEDEGELELWPTTIMKIEPPNLPYNWFGNPTYGPGLPMPFGYGDSCCVEEFEYPKTREAVFRELGAGYFAGVRFTAHLKYSDDRDRGCNCDCCVFKQYAESTSSTTYLLELSEAHPPTPGTAVEDCVAPDGTPTAQTGVAPEDPSTLQCYGDEKDWKKGPPGEVGSKEVWYENRTTRCTVYMLDTPGLFVGYYEAYSQTHKFIAKVHDACHFYIVRDQRKWGFSMSSQRADHESDDNVPVYSD